MGDCTRRLCYVVDVCTYYELDVYITNLFVYIVYWVQKLDVCTILVVIYRDDCMYIWMFVHFSFLFRPNHLETVCFTLSRGA